MAFYYLLLGHLVGDFALQTDKMAENKGRSWRWNLLHVLVVTAVTAVFSYSFGVPLFVMVLLNGAVHFFMDFYKNKLCRVLHLSELQGFIIDQMIHILLLYIISKTAVYDSNQFFGFKTVSLLIALMLATFFAAVFTQFILAALFPRPDDSFFKDGEKYTGIFTRIYVAIVLYLSITKSPYYLLLLTVSVIIFFVRFKLGWNKWMSPSHLVVKLLLDAAISAVCVFPLVLF